MTDESGFKELTPRVLVRRVEDNSVTYWASSPTRRDRLDTSRDEVVGVALTRKRAVIGESHVWDEFCDTVALASERVLWAEEMSEFPALDDPFGTEPQPGRESENISLSTVATEISEEIVTQRHQRGWSRQELADRTEIPRRTLSHWENAENVPQPEQLEQLAAVFDETDDEKQSAEKSVETAPSVTPSNTNSQRKGTESDE